jgi:hypothetical protein
MSTAQIPPLRLQRSKNLPILIYEYGFLLCLQKLFYGLPDDFFCMREYGITAVPV